MSDCIFCRIARGEIPSKKVYEDEHVYAFHDINPVAPVHVLVIPKGPYVDHAHFAAEASEAEIVDFTRAVAEICRLTGVTPGAGGGGFRAISNAGEAGVQEVPHFHLHILGGRMLGRMLARTQG